MHFERHVPFQNAYFFSRRKIIKKKQMGLPYLKFSDPLPETLILLFCLIVKNYITVVLIINIFFILIISYVNKQIKVIKIIIKITTTTTNNNNDSNKK